MLEWCGVTLFDRLRMFLPFLGVVTFFAAVFFTAVFFTAAFFTGVFLTVFDTAFLLFFLVVTIIISACNILCVNRSGGF